MNLHIFFPTKHGLRSPKDWPKEGQARPISISPCTTSSSPVWFDSSEGGEEKLAMMQWCGAAARRMMTTMSGSSAMAPSSSSSSSVAMGVPILCGRGDKKTKRGKRFKGSYGNARPKKEKKIERIKDRVEVPRSTPWPLPFKLI